MDSNEIYSKDRINRFDRVGDRSLKIERNRIACYVLVGIIILLGIMIGKQVEEYIQSFAKTRKEAIAPFQKLEGVPTWKLIVTN